MQKQNDTAIFNNFRDIRNGFTPFNELYVKHFTFYDEIKLREYYEEQLENLTEIPLEEEQLELLIDKGIWKKKQEGELNLKRVRLKAAETTLPNLLVESQKRPIEDQITQLTSEVRELELDKSEYMGITREAIANTNAYEHILY